MKSTHPPTSLIGPFAYYARFFLRFPPSLIPNSVKTVSKQNYFSLIIISNNIFFCFLFISFLFAFFLDFFVFLCSFYYFLLYYIRTPLTEQPILTWLNRKLKKETIGKYIFLWTNRLTDRPTDAKDRPTDRLE